MDKQHYEKHYMERPPRPAFGKILGFGMPIMIQITLRFGLGMLNRLLPSIQVAWVLSTLCTEGWKLENVM